MPESKKENKSNRDKSYKDKSNKDKENNRKNKNNGDDSEIQHWADKVAFEVKQRIERDPRLKEIYKKNGVIVYDEKTPSGVIHIGSGRGWIIHDVITKALKSNGMKSKFILSSDDMDPYDKPNKELDRTWDKYLGMPFRNIPSPEKGYKSFAHYYFSQVTEKFDEFGIDAELESTGEQYINGAFNPMIKFILDNHEKVQKTYSDLYGDTDAFEKIPFNVICPKCKKIATTLATKWDKEKELLYFECKNGVVEWADGCGYKGEISPYDGNGKFPWKVEWAAKWPTKNVIVEYAGKDHFTQGGSRTFACKLATDLIKYPSPYPSDGYRTGKGYEFFTIGGAKMSTSKGKGFGFREAAEMIPPKILRFLLVKTRPKTVIDFDPYNTNDLILLFDRYDKAERIYFGVTDGESESTIKNQKRIYELSHVGDIPKKLPLQISLSFAGMVMQTVLNDIDKAIEILKEMGHLPGKTTKKELETVVERLEFSKRWVGEFATDDYKFQLVEKVTSKVDKEIKKMILELAELLKKKKYEEKTLFEEFYNLCKKHNIENKEFFKTVYMILINKEKGPRLAPFILTIGQKKVAQLLDQI
ncbi:MAG: lysine--tRNA ligase [Candidatus Woesearchaeota archaeon]